MLKRSQHRTANAAEAPIRRYVVQSDLSGVGDTADRKNVAILYGYEQGIAGVASPRSENLGGLIAQPTIQDSRIVVMIGDAELRYGPSQNLAGGYGIFGFGIAYVHGGPIADDQLLGLHEFNTWS
jgi:hypothetical protein